MKHLDIIVRGRVQRVGFRFFTREVADRYGVTGFVTNRDDGSVWIEAEGGDEAMERFLEWCHTGPLGAYVEEVISFESETKGYTSFEIRSRANWLNPES